MRILIFLGLLIMSLTAHAAPFKLSSAFDYNKPIPSDYNCEGKNVSPPLKWSGAPKSTQSFVLIVDDPDAPDPKKPELTWVHWVLYNIPATADHLDEDVKDLPPGTMAGLNDWKKNTYGGPCAHIGRHRYFYKLYALDIPLKDLKSPTKKKVEKAMKNHIMGEAFLVGTFERTKK